MADELWIVRDDQSCGWCVDAKGKITTDDEYVTEGRERINIGVPDAPLTQKQADAIRGLICDLRKDDVLEFNPAVGAQYPQRTTVASVQQAMTYLHAWPDDCDEDLHTSADLGLSSEIPWVDGVAVAPPDQASHQDDPSMAPQTEKVRARNEKGHFIADNPDTDENEAWVEASSSEADEQEPAAGDSQEQQGGEATYGGDSTLDMPAMVDMCAPGDKGEAVETWQAVCNEILHMNDSIEAEPIGVDGSFGEQTEELTRVIQQELGVPVTGVLDQATWDAVSNG